MSFHVKFLLDDLEDPFKKATNFEDDFNLDTER